MRSRCVELTGWREVRPYVYAVTSKHSDLADTFWQRLNRRVSYTRTILHSATSPCLTAEHAWLVRPRAVGRDSLAVSSASLHASTSWQAHHRATFQWVYQWRHSPDDISFVMTVLVPSDILFLWAVFWSFEMYIIHRRIKCAIKFTHSFNSSCVLSFFCRSSS